MKGSWTKAIVRELKTRWPEALVGHELQDVIFRLTTRKAELTEESEGDTPRVPAPLTEADVMCSDLKSTGRHLVLLDCDYPVHVIESSTPGHHHLILDVPGGVEHQQYMKLLAALGQAGVIEEGYANVSVNRGHSDLRLPWIQKENQKR